MKSLLKLFFLIFFTHKIYAQQKILFANEFQNEMHLKFMEEKKMQSVIIFYQDEFVLNDSTKFNQNMLQKAIMSKIPNPKATGYAVLDWEGRATNILFTSSISSKIFKEMTVEYVKSIEFAKKIRPNIQWGFYNFPAVNYGSISTKQENNIYNRYLPIMKASDFLTPSLYLLHDRSEVSDSFSYQYAATNTKMAIKFGEKLNKKVFPFIWQRYTGNSRSLNKLIEPKHFQNFVRTILNQAVDKNKVDGVIWWDCESYLFNERNNFKNIKNEYSKIVGPRAYQKNILNKYYPLIKAK